MSTPTPLSQIFATCAKYELLSFLQKWMDTGIIMPTSTWRSIVMNAIYRREYSMWKCLCLLFPRSKLFSSIIPDIRICVWWQIAQKHILLAKHCVTIVKLITRENCLRSNTCRYDVGTDHADMQCTLCGAPCETECHFLWECCLLSDYRRGIIRAIDLSLDSFAQSFFAMDTCYVRKWC